jgi:hypothetical protein
MAWELDEPFAALINSSAKHSAIVFTLWNAASRAPVHSSQMAYEKNGTRLPRLRQFIDELIPWTKDTKIEIFSKVMEGGHWFQSINFGILFLNMPMYNSTKSTNDPMTH